MTNCKILLVDDHPLFRAGLESLINCTDNLQVIGQAKTPTEGLQLFEKLSPDLIISDLSFGKNSGLALIKKIREAPSDCPILILSMHEESFWAEQVLKHGANGYIQKDVDAETVISAIKATYNGEIFLSHKMQQKLLKQLSGLTENNVPLQSLSKREMEIFQYMAQGFSTTDIARSLFISIKTVQTHQSNIKTKLQQDSLKSLRSLAEGFSEPKPTMGNAKTV